LYFVLDELKRRGMPYDLALLPAVESGYMPLAFSQGRAAGLWQFIPETGRHYGLQQNWWYDGRRDIYASTHAALDYLSSLNRRFNGDWLLTLAAYNAGPLRVLRAMERNKKIGKATDYWHLNLPRETRNYVPKLLAIRAIIENPQANGIELWPITDRPVILAVDVGAQIELSRAAEMAEMDLEELYLLNAGFNRWATAPDGPHRLLLPIDKTSPFRKRLAKTPPSRRVVWFRHTIRNGDTLEGIARKYNTSVDHILHTNELRSSRIIAGKHLLVPKMTFPGEVAAMQTIAPYRISSSQSLRRHHTIRRGETLWSISRRHDVSLKELIDWNQLAPNEILIVGDRLVIKQPSTVKLGASSGQKSKTNSEQRYMQTISYSVKTGDSLYGIARRFNVRVADLMRWNTLPNAPLLHPGEIVKVRVDLTRQSSDS
jgi:membrane-bound lytic murein transglycosylase D